ncbi:hypothetical protein WMO64_06460 [Pseudoflavonifractor sp. CLA-AP-H29]|uniref:Uncharacterized protein n=1 Tax=Pseudoflavonifractor intestinihominis TaxID=3133171 RepID=A0ABV1E717_9FIRM
MKTSKKAPGFYVTLFSCVLAIVSAVCYGVIFREIEYKEPVFDLRICIIMAAAGVVAAVLLFVNERTAGFAPALLCLGSGISLMLFIKIAIWPVSDTIYGIEPFPAFTQLVACAVLLVVTLVVSEVVLYMKKYRSA